METRSLIFLCLLFSLCFSQKSHPCSTSLTVDISNNAVELPNNPGVFQHDDVIYNQSNYYFEDSGKRMGCFCDIKKCIRKCCQRNFYMSSTNDSNFHCVKNTGNFSLVFYHEKQKNDQINLNNYSMFFGSYCSKGFFAIPVDSGDSIFMQENGTLYYDDGDEWIALYNLDRYCVDLFDNELLAIVCEPEDEETEMQRTVNGIGLFISMPFLFITFLVYVILPERNLHRRALICYVTCALAANTTLLIAQIYPHKFPQVSCHLIGYLIIYFFLASFIWLNVMCTDMWLAFSSSTGFLSKKTADRKKFIIYSIYAWGVPLCFVIMVMIINKHADERAHYHPNLGNGSCFLKEGWPKLYYFYLPMAILITVNLILFIVTSLKIYNIKRETKMLKRTDSKIHTYEDDKQKFKLYLRLMFAMGINWITEIISWAVVWKSGETKTVLFYISYLTDLTNALYGLVIFLIFVFKKKIWRGLQKRYYGCIGKPELAKSTSTRTRASNYSTDSVVSTVDHSINSSPRVSEEIIPLKGKQSK